MQTLLPSEQTIAFNFQLGSDFVKQLFRIQIQKGGIVILWNQVKSRIEACYSEFILVTFSLIVSKMYVHWHPTWLHALIIYTLI